METICHDTLITAVNTPFTLLSLNVKIAAKFCISVFVYSIQLMSYRNSTELPGELYVSVEEYESTKKVSCGFHVPACRRGLVSTSGTFIRLLV